MEVGSFRTTSKLEDFNVFDEVSAMALGGTLDEADALDDCCSLTADDDLLIRTPVSCDRYASWS